MSLVVQIVLALALLVGLIAPWISNKTWHWSQVLLLNCIVLAGVGFLLLAAETVRTHHVLRAKIPKLEKDLESAQQQHENLLHGSGNNEGVLDLEHQLQMVARNRGRVWRNVMPVGQPDNQGNVNVEIAQPKPHGLAVGSIVFAFETSSGGQPADSGSEEVPAEEAAEEAPADESAEPSEATTDTTTSKQYLGEFRVTAVDENGVSLEPVLLLTQRTGQRIFDSQGPWSLYETMPVDRHSIFAGMTEEELRQLLPVESVEEFIRHGAEANPDDNELDRIGLDENDQRVADEQAVKFIFDRPLRDYAFLFADLAQKRVLLQARIQAVTEDNAKLTASIEGGKELGKFREQQKQLLDADLKGMQADRQAIEAHRDRLLQMLGNAEKQIASRLDENSQMANQLTEKQLNQLQLINSTAPAPAGADVATP